MKRFFSIVLLLVFTTYTFGISMGHYCDEEADHLIDSTVATAACCDKHDSPQKDCEHYPHATKKENEAEQAEESAVFSPTIIGFIQSFALYFTSKDDSFQEPKQNDNSSPALLENLFAYLKSLVY